jgi:hypothetical protein
MVKSKSQQAAIAISMKKAGKKPKSLKKAENGMIVKGKKIVDKNSYSAVRDNGTSVNVKKKTTWDNTGTKDKPIATNQRSTTRTTTTDSKGKTKTTVRKVDSEGMSKSRRAIIPVRKKGGMVKSKKK